MRTTDGVQLVKFVSRGKMLDLVPIFTHFSISTPKLFLG